MSSNAIDNAKTRREFEVKITMDVGDRCGVEFLRQQSMQGEGFVRWRCNSIGIFKCGATVTVGVALLLELLPSSFFNHSRVSRTIEGFSLHNKHLYDSFLSIESSHPGYGVKFFCSIILLAITFCIVASLQVVATVVANKTPAALMVMPMESRTLFSFIVCIIVVLVLAQLIWPGFFLVKGRIDSIPILFRALLWVATEWLLSVCVVLLMRGSFRYAA